MQSLKIGQRIGPQVDQDSGGSSHLFIVTIRALLSKSHFFPSVFLNGSTVFDANGLTDRHTDSNTDRHKDKQ